MLYNITISQIDSSGFQYICGMLESPKLNDRGLWHNIKAFDVLINHRKQRTKISTFNWINGVACDFKNIKTIENEVITDSEIEKVLTECGLI